MTRSGSVLPG